jgi:predicted GNAT family acetyltransferase
MDGSTDVVVRDAPHRHRYEAVIGGDVAGFVAYHDMTGDLALTHTEVAGEFEGRGVGGALARAALDDARARGVKVRPDCPIIAGWIQRHPDYQQLVSGN